MQLIGGTIGISIANTVFTNKLQSTLAVLAPNAPLAVIRSVEAIKLVPEAQRTPIIQSYAIALNYVFIIGELGFFLTRRTLPSNSVILKAFLQVYVRAWEALFAAISTSRTRSWLVAPEDISRLGRTDT